MVKVDFELIDRILTKHEYDKGNIIAIMQEIQEEYRYLPQETIPYIAKKIGVGYIKAQRGDFNDDFNNDYNNQQ